MKILYLILCSVAVLASVFVSYLYLLNRGKEEKDFKCYFKISYNKKKLIFCAGVFACAALTFILTYAVRDNALIRTMLLTETSIWLALIGIIDYKEKIIPNALVLAGFVLGIIFVLLDIFVVKSMSAKKSLAFHLLGAVAYGLVFFIIALIVKSALGMGDVKMFTVIGLMYGLLETYSILLASVIVMAVFAIIMLIAKKVDKKTAIPMAPFVFIGFMVNVLLGM